MSAFRRWVFAGLVFAAPAFAQTAARPASRIAVVIGNDDYGGASRLRNAGADARALAGELKGRGFDVLEGYDLDRPALMDLINFYGDQLARYKVALFYFSGQGVQLHGQTYLVPTGTKLDGATEDSLAAAAVPVASIAEKMQSTNPQAFDLLILDANRDNPFMAAARGTAQPAASAVPGVLIVQAAGTDQVALDTLGPNDHDPNSVFTRELLKAIRAPDVPIRTMLSGLRDAVSHDAAATGREQTPAISDAASGDFMFTPGPASAASPEPPKPVTPPPPPVAAAPAVPPPEPPPRSDQLAGLSNAEAPPTPQAQEAALSRQDRRVILTQLRQLGHFDGSVDGAFGPAARAAMKQFQAFQGDPETGILTDAERGALSRQSAALAALLERPDHSPHGLAAASAPRPIERELKAFRLANPPAGQSADFAEAAYWYALAGAQGDRNALLALGNMEARGQGLPAPDPAAAGLLWRAAAAHGDPHALFNLGVMAESDKDIPAALRWYRHAAKLNYAPASVSLKRLEPRPAGTSSPASSGRPPP